MPAIQADSLVVDLNDDELNDVVTTNWISADISVLLNAPNP